MKGAEIRKKFLEFFASKDHDVYPSASLVPVDDPSLLWINAGMAPLKPFFDGRKVPPNPRIASSQKCIRTNDIENVGKTARHQTFFEMLGNFSIGDYFKKEAIDWAWEFLTEHMGLDPDRLSVTIHPEDDEAYELWHRRIGVPAHRIFRMEDNFWEIGEGPSGPCSEIFYDRGEDRGCGRPECNVGCECDRFLEIWNLVFTQFNHNPDGTYTPLPKKNIDTGMGLERMASVMQDVDSNFDTDLFRPIIEAAAEAAGVQYGQEKQRDVALKVIADHIRTAVFAVGDGVLPGNEGRSYIIRRLLRRAVRYGRNLGFDRPFLYRLVPVVGEVMGEAYPEIVEKGDFIVRAVKAEEERFLETLAEGEQVLEDYIEKLRSVGRTTLAGEDAFRLYDTFGFPIDLTKEIASEQGIDVDEEGFARALEAQRERARAARQDVESMQSKRGVLVDLEVPSRFVGYDVLETQARVEVLVVDDRVVERVSEGDQCLVVLNETPFYAESGGQVADRGSIETASARLEVEDVQKAPRGQHVHRCRVVRGTVTAGEVVRARVDRRYREDIIKNHTATHLLHKALREVLGEHVAQAGSLVADSRLRFDFSHYGPLAPEELEAVERVVNEEIWRNEPVDIREMPLDEAKAMGAMALFGEKYGERVRVVKAGDFSIELCGGCHVRRTSEIGVFKIVSETGIGSGVRRVEAVTGRHAYAFLDSRLKGLDRAASLLRVAPADVPDKLEQVLGDMKETERELESWRDRWIRSQALRLADGVTDIQGVPVVAEVVEGATPDQMRRMVDVLRETIHSGVVVLGSKQEDKVMFVAAVSPDWVAKGLHAGQLVKEVAAAAGGGGGGKPDLAQAGGRHPEKLAEALSRVPGWVMRQRGAGVS
ncbi:MAG: alanine--tRNA ligase [Kyrpidia tusciae]|nr:alanine--tRNA ligase [Kyrpidia tusciae]MBE3551981.1 alanine--tRNA ligase [Kyrpidia tusciae]